MIPYFTSLKADICFWTRFTNLHCITRLRNTRRGVKWVWNKRASLHKLQSECTGDGVKASQGERASGSLLDVLFFVGVGDDHVSAARLQLVLVRLRQNQEVKFIRKTPWRKNSSFTWTLFISLSHYLSSDLEWIITVSVNARREGLHDPLPRTQ